jgi:hypothetical protein
MLAPFKWMFGWLQNILVKFYDDVTINAYTKTNYKFLCDVKTIMVPLWFTINASFRSFIQHTYMLHKVFWSLKNDT